jgi:hypothetical protein
MGEPPVEVGGNHETVTLLFPGDAHALIGGPGLEAGITPVLATEGSLAPIPLIAVTVKV